MEFTRQFWKCMVLRQDHRLTGFHQCVFAESIYLHLPVPYIFGTRGRSLPDIWATGSLVPNIYGTGR